MRENFNERRKYLFCLISSENEKLSEIGNYQCLMNFKNFNEKINSGKRKKYERIMKENNLMEE